MSIEVAVAPPTSSVAASDVTNVVLDDAVANYVAACDAYGRAYEYWRRHREHTPPGEVLDVAGRRRRERRLVTLYQARAALVDATARLEKAGAVVEVGMHESDLARVYGPDHRLLAQIEG